ncbi:3-oxoacyl-acyl-carrier synthase-like protein (Protein of unknown function DUF455) [Wolffia australiana]
MAGEQTLVEAALQVLNEADPFRKAKAGQAAAAAWLQGSISTAFSDPLSGHLLVPDRPARLPTMTLLPSRSMPKLGKGGTLRSRQAILHSLVHTESWAIDLSWDIIARFGRQEAMPREFFTDFVRVAEDECRHFTLLAARLDELGSFYGAFPVHDGLWDSAIETSHDLLPRLAIEHCVHEARGLDVLPTTISKFRKNGDERTAELLESVVYPEEISHCAAGVKWFRYLCTRRSKINSPGEEISVLTDDAVVETFHQTVRRYFKGVLKPPFNEEARSRAGFSPSWYEPLVTKG